MTATPGPCGDDKRVLVAMLAIALVVASVFGTSVALTTPLSFDGALNAQAAMNLVEHGRYALGRSEFRDFDHRVQTGPTVVLPTALAFSLLGVGNSVAQIANLMYFVLFFALATLFTYRHAGAAGALLAIVLLIQTPDIGPLGLGFYGEVPALVFFLGALLLLDHLENRPGPVAAAAVGTLLGLAVLTKIVMLIPVSVVGLVFAAASVTRRSVKWRQWAALVVGGLCPLAVFEAVKLLVLGPTLWIDWWAVMVRRVGVQGLPLGMRDTAGVAPKTATHLKILGEIVGVPEWSLLLLLIVPTLLLALFWRFEKTENRPESWFSLSVVSLWLAASSYLGWWLVLTPTSRAWPRRVLIGLLLQELLISIVVGGAILWAARRRRERHHGGFRSVGWKTAVLAALLLLAVGSLLAHNLPRTKLQTEVSKQRRDIETVAETMRSLPWNAVFYGIGWYRAPVLGLLSGREIEDFGRFPVRRYGKPLRDTYFVVDNHLANLKPQLVQRVLARSVHQAVVQSGDCALYRLEKVLPYLPITQPDQSRDLAAVIHPKQDDDYPFVGGLGREAPAGRYSEAVAAFVLERGDRGCLLVDFLTLRTVAGRPSFEVRVDHQKVRSVRPVVGRPRTLLIPLGKDTEPDTPGSLVELWMFTDQEEKPFSLWSGGKENFVVREVGFVPCPSPDDRGRTGS